MLMRHFGPALLVGVLGVPPAVAQEAAAAPERSIGTAVASGLRWLAQHQSVDGRWSAAAFMAQDPPGAATDGAGKSRHDVGVTGLAMLALLGDGNTMRVGPYRDQIKRSAKWLRDNQDAKTGLFGPATTRDFAHGHAVASLAMIEAYGLSEYKLLRKYAQRSVNYLQKHRDPAGVWGYRPGGGAGDTVITTWALMASDAARTFKLDVDEKARRDVAAWYEQVTHPRTGIAGYTKRGEPSSRPDGLAVRFPPEHTQALTASVLYGWHLLGHTAMDQPIMAAAADRVFRTPPVWNEEAGTIDFYYWYFGTLAMQCTGGPQWEKWSERISTTLLEHQRQDGSFAGSWDPVGAWGSEGGRVYATAMAVLTLLVVKRA